MRIHFIAIGGSVMHNLAISLATSGHQVSGSDDLIVEPSKSRLRQSGLLPKELGWHPEMITSDVDAIILGKHAAADNPELLKAQELSIKIYSFPEFVYEQSIQKTRVVIAGSYGKTTITSMIMHVLKKLGKEFDYLVGAKLEGFDSLIKLTPSAPIIIIEGDEFFASSIDHQSKFHYYHPNIALISNIYWDNFKALISEDEYYRQFETFIDTIVAKGTLIYNKDDQNLRKIVEETMDCKINRHGYKLPTYTINKGVTFLQVGERGIPLEVIGKQNLSNIAGAFTVCEWLGIKREGFYDAIKDFKSSIRYLEFVASENGSVVYQDFAHTPSKLRSSIHAIKEQFSTAQLLTVIELNPYDVLDDSKVIQYAGSLDESNFAIVFINKNSIKEKNILLDNISNKTKEVFNHPNLYIITELEGLYTTLEQFDSKGVNMLFMSSNNYTGLNLLDFADKFLQKNA
ncbi:peptidoglycan synthetase [Sphingobacterium alkalisoli]|uniref:Peptidoglycan synthetase n=1 Tax=Sphingobacterium alkalisoli TaxID=1874115 RepID=A0A4U0GXB8_9SPHI|nr:Mur ligase family protein [Sphingobacterium alkalisoli]TJY63773.1 peptidoglycan synthetase [Sphingobacterium alkalisoli]GGH24966.1 peptidoglycan synthetase [Sphingobacterium alkalisoli]